MIEVDTDAVLVDVRYHAGKIEAAGIDRATRDVRTTTRNTTSLRRLVAKATAEAASHPS